MHFGHANALRQAKELAEHLVVGVVSQDEIAINKGPPVMTASERLAAVRGCKWADEVIAETPFTLDLETMDRHNCHYCAHGDDITVDKDGVDSYWIMKRDGRYLEYPRTEGISTTELVGRMLLFTKDHHLTDNPFADPAKQHYYTTRMLRQFSSNREQKSSDRVVYVDGSFDLFHAGHIELLRKARELGDFLVVGIHEDRIINQIKGSNYPLMNTIERVLGVLSCRYVDDVVIGAPYCVTKEFMSSRSLNISVVVHGKQPSLPGANGEDPYAYPKEVGKYIEVETEFSYLTATVIIDRILNNHKIYEERNRRKLKK